MRYFFVETIELGSWLMEVWPSLRRGAAAGGTGRLFFVDGSGLAIALAVRMAARLGIKVERLRFDATQIIDRQGMLIWLRIYYRDMAETLAHVLAEPEFRHFLASDASANLKLYVTKQALPGTPLFVGSGLWRAIFLVQVALWRLRSEGVVDGQALLFLCRSPWIDGIVGYARAHGRLQILPYGWGFRPGDALRRLLGRDALIVRDKLQGLTAGRRPQTGPLPVTPCVAIQCYGHFNLDQPQRYSDFFFWQQSQFPGERLLALFNLPQDPLDQERRDALSRQGIRGLALRRAAAGSAQCPLFTDSALVSRLADACRLLAGALPPLRRGWLAGEAMAFAGQKDYWKRLFRQQGVSVFVTWFKYNGDHCTIGEALRELGGALALYQRSYEGNATPQTALVSDVYFGFATDGARVEAEAGSTIDYYVTTGYLGDHRFPLVRDSALALRRSLFSEGARRIVAYFDEGSFPDSRWGVDAKRLQGHYAFLLEKLMQEEDLGLVLKPKSPATLTRRLGSVGALLERALNTGRCHLYGDGIVQSVQPPVQAALSADLVIHGSVASGTAAVEAALAGAPVVLLDDDGWRNSPLYRLGKGQVIFDDWKVLWHTWKQYQACSHAVPGFADWSPILNELDPFRDGRAAERMGTYLAWMVDGFHDGLSRESVLAQAAERYRKAWGADKVRAVRPAIREPATMVHRNL